jgi:hypothetical protein
MPVNVGDVVLPGETLADASELGVDNKKIVLGNGLRFVTHFLIFSIYLHFEYF